MTQTVPTILVLSGLDPSGGAGLQADIEAMASHGCHACPIMTVNTTQDTSNVYDLVACDADLLARQMRTILEDIPVSTIKIGLLSDIAVIESIHNVLSDYPDIPVILDPVLKSGAGSSLVGVDVQQSLTRLLLPLTTVLTPNTLEARQLAPHADNLDACAMALLDMGCEFVLLTGSHESTEKVTNTLYGNRRLLETFHWQRLPDEYHGSGCTLAASIAGLLAQGYEPFSAIHQAQQYTWECLSHAYRSGKGQLIPNRLFWARGDNDTNDK